MTALDHARATVLEVVERQCEALLWSSSLAISGGPSEILGGSISRQRLGLPRA